jgi:hypothetical protein
LKYFAIRSGPEYATLPVFFSLCTELSAYRHFAEGLLDHIYPRAGNLSLPRNKIEKRNLEIEIEQTLGRRRIFRAPLSGFYSPFPLPFRVRSASPWP